MNISHELEWLKTQGCYPSIYRRGGLWRAHVNSAGNFWADAPTPDAALTEAMKLWAEAGRPMDGEADKLWDR